MREIIFETIPLVQVSMVGMGGGQGVSGGLGVPGGPGGLGVPGGQAGQRNPQHREREIIWSGELEWQEKVVRFYSKRSFTYFEISLGTQLRQETIFSRLMSTHLIKNLKST